jgi:hypothetical protein
MGTFLGRPTRGGKLTIVNCLLWATVALGAATDSPSPLLLFPALVACWPVAWLLMLPTGHLYESAGTLVVACMVVRMNSLLWGYGISWLLSMVTRRRTGAGK